MRLLDPYSHILLLFKILGQCDLIPSFHGSKFYFLVISYITCTWLLVNNHLRKLLSVFTKDT